MTITLEYTDLHFDDEDEVMQASDLEFQHDLLYAQIMFRVDSADFTFDEYTTLLDAAAILRGRIHLLADGDTSSYESPVSGETLTFARSGDQVAISANYTDATVTVGLAELKTAVDEFYDRVVQDLLIRYPGLDQAPGAKEYFDFGPAPGA